MLAVVWNRSYNNDDTLLFKKVSNSVYIFNQGDPCSDLEFLAHYKEMAKEASFCYEYNCRSLEMYKTNKNGNIELHSNIFAEITALNLS